MTPFARQDKEITAEFARVEVNILVQLATDVRSLLADADQVDPSSPSARALDRLLPAAYRDGAENDAEFRRFTAEGIIDRKVHNADELLRALATGAASGSAVWVALDAAGAQAWLRCLTDIRLTIAAGLGIEQDGDELRVDTNDRYALDVYGWVGYVLESLLNAMESDLS
jgi:hypothetical protein